ncbi:hypothetical protein I546_4524 [Mycobacterium kansasii 732]|nr:hypothetical protein I546_4524 [Mycobacterium kansasii 732]
MPDSARIGTPRVPGGVRQNNHLRHTGHNCIAAHVGAGP